MATDRPDPGEFLDMAQRMLRELFGGQQGAGEPWAEATRPAVPRGGPTPERQRENLTFALATRAVEALEDLALNVAAIRQRLERTAPAGGEPRAAGDQPPAGDKPPAGDQPPAAEGW
jgi:hypothetical protein